MRLHALFVGLLILQTAQFSRAEDSITLMYNQRPPYRMTLPDGSVGGTAAKTAASAFERAGIPYHWQELPAARQWAIVQQDLSRACGVGFHHTPERDSVALFTLPIDDETAFVAVSNNKFLIPYPISLDELVANPDYTVQAKIAKSYGSILDEKFKQLAARIEWTSLDLESSIRMVHAGRPIIVFMTEREAEYYRSKEAYIGDSLRVLRFPELGAGEPLHLMCSKSVGAAVIAQLNRALAAMASVK